MLIPALIISLSINGQYLELNTPSPEANALVSSIEVPIGKYTGTYGLSLPVYTITEGSLKIPVTLDYRGESKPNAEVAGPAGLGWNINAGGFLTRKVNGLPDDQINGFLETREQYSYSEIQGYIENGDATQLDFLENNCVDTQPDEFFFNIGGISGKFAFSWNVDENIVISCKDKVTIESYEFSQEVTYPIDAIINFKIIGPNGISYSFGSQLGNNGKLVKEANEVTNSMFIWQSGQFNCQSFLPIPGRIIKEYISGWYLTDVIDLKNPSSRVSFWYQENSYTDKINTIETLSTIAPYNKLGESISLSDYDLLIKNNGRFRYNTVPFYSGKTVLNWSIIEANFSNEIIDFMYNTDRIDIAGVGDSIPKRLDEIFVGKKNNAISNNLKYKYKLDYNTDSKLLLKSFQKVGYEEKKVGGEVTLVEINEPPYEFFYNNPVNNADNSKSVDHWGYANGSTTTTNLPDINISYFELPGADNNFYWDGSAKNPNLEGSESYVMNKIIYPTGGYKKFDFELNKASTINGANINLDAPFYDDFLEKELVTESILCQSKATGMAACSESFVISEGLVEVALTGRIYTDGNNFNSYKASIGANGNGVVFDVKISDLSDDQITAQGNGWTEFILKYFFNSTEAEYEISIELRNAEFYPQEYLNLGYQIYSPITEDENSNPITDINIGGVRVKNVSEYDENNVLTRSTDYEYTLDNKSSGAIYALPKYYDELPSLLTEKMR